MNGFLYRDADARWLCAYMGLYPRGYRGPTSTYCHPLPSRNEGWMWEGTGPVLTGALPYGYDAVCFVRRSGTIACDVLEYAAWRLGAE